MFWKRSDPLPDLSPLMNSVCQVRGHFPLHDTAGQGVLLLPDVFLTAWHIVRGADRVSVFNAASERALLQPGTTIRKDEDLDLALFELSRPLSGMRVPLGGDKHNLARLKGTLMTRYNGDAAQYAAGVDPTWAGRRMQDPARKQNSFVSALNSQCGHSGAPLFDSKGRLCTVLHGSYPDGSCANRAGNAYRFLAPPPERVAAFIAGSIGAP